MTKEQEVKEILNKFKNNETQRDKLERGRDGGWKIGDIYKHLELNPAIETALSMLKEKDKEIEKYKYLYQKALDNTVKADRENIKKDKQIDFMSEYIASLDIEEDICSKIGKENCDKMSFGECEDCIKQYFERKSRE